MRQLLSRRALLGWVGMLAAATASAASLHVAPVRLALTPVRPVAALTLGNGEEEEVAVQVDVLAWTQRDGQDVYEPTRDVLVNPSIFRVAGRGQQIVRLGLQAPTAGDVERSYRVFFQQLPREQAVSAQPGTGPQLQTLLRIGVPLFVPARAPHQALQWRLQPETSGAGPAHRLWLDNQGTDHLQVTGLQLHDAGGRELLRKSVSWYVLPGQSGSVALALPALAPDTRLQLLVTSDAPQALPPVPLRLPRAEAAAR